MLFSFPFSHFSGLSFFFLCVLPSVFLLCLASVDDPPSLFSFVCLAIFSHLSLCVSVCVCIDLGFLCFVVYRFDFSSSFACAFFLLVALFCLLLCCFVFVFSLFMTAAFSFVVIYICMFDY